MEHATAEWLRSPTKPGRERDVITPGRAWQIIGTKIPPARSPKST
jgi:hypothetical protein